jgi:type IX secretion system PorP/SprF family membrane protein
MNKFYFVFLICFFLSPLFLSGQDLHYSQFYNSPMNLNPAQTGVFNGDKRFTLSYRDQWRFVPVAWTTFSMSYDFKKYLENDRHFLGFGANLNYDRQGDSKLTLTGLNLGGSYTRALNRKNLISGGIIFGYNTRGFNTNTLKWDKQWNGVSFDPNLPSNESFDARRVGLFELAGGFNYRWQKTERTKVDVGIGAYHIHQPSTTFYDAPNEVLPLHMTYSAIGSAKLSKEFDVQLSAMYQKQEEYNETLFGVLGKIYVNQKRGKELQVHPGLLYRTSGSIIPTIGIQFNEWYASFSYDLDSTNFNDITSSNRGGPEFHVRYIIKSVRPLTDRKNCPIY